MLTRAVPVGALLAGVAGWALSGCATGSRSTAEAAPVATQATAAAPAAPGGAIKPVADANEPGALFVETATFDRAGLATPDKVLIYLSFADLSISTGAPARAGAHLRIARVAGGAECLVRAEEKAGMLLISEARAPLVGRQMPRAAAGSTRFSAVSKGRSAIPDTGCRYAVELSSPEAAELLVDLKRGSVLVENWAEAVSVKLDWGDVDVGAVGPLNVECGWCTLTGEGVRGSLHYAIENGNVGMADLAGSVEGHTSGDTVLKWSRLPRDGSVKLASTAGDVILVFPGGMDLNIDLKAPRGEIYPRVDDDSAKRLGCYEGKHPGIPVTVSAAAGNVRIYRGNR
jgi:hypothetical protein